MLFELISYPVTLFMILLGVLTAPAPKPAPEPLKTPEVVVQAPAPKVNEANNYPILSYINNTRKGNGLNEVWIDRQLFNSAAAKCAHMVKYDYWAHNGGGTTWSAIAWQHVSGYSTLGEILANDFHGNLSELYVAWLQSPTHKEQIVRPAYTHAGMATCNYNDGSDLTVVHFGG